MLLCRSRKLARPDKLWRVCELVRTLLEARDERQLGRLLKRLRKVDLLVLDALGFVPFDRAGGELLFNLFDLARKKWTRN